MEETQPKRGLKEEIEYLFYFYRYVVTNEWKELFILLGINFFLGLLPLIIVWFSVINLNESLQKQFYGDGAIIIFCFGVLVSFSSYLFNNGNDSESQNKKLLYIFLIAVYIIAAIIFRDAQLNFNRDWAFITNISIASGIFLLISIFIVINLRFSTLVGYDTIQPFKEEIKLKTSQKKMKKLKKNKGNLPKL